MSPKLKSILARVSLVGGVAFLTTYMARHAPHQQSLGVRTGGREITHLEAVITRAGDDEPTEGFSLNFPGGCPHVIRHAFSAPNGTYTVVITWQERAASASSPESPENTTKPGDLNPIPTETTFERRVSLGGGEVIVSPD